MQQQPLSPESSLQIIQNMIDKAKNSVADDSFYFLLWGWLVFIASIGQFVLKVLVKSPYHYVVWSLMVVGVIASAIYGYRVNRNAKVKTYVNELLDYLWIGILLSYILFGFIFARTGWQNCYPFYMSLYAIGSYVSGRALKFPPLVWGALASWVLAIISTFTPFDLNILLCGLAILFSNIIPGYLLKNKYRKMKAHV